MEQGLLHPLAFRIFKDGIQKRSSSTLRSAHHLPPPHGSPAGFCLPVEQDLKFTLYSNNLIERGNQKMPGTYCRVTNVQGIDNRIGFFFFFDLFIKRIQDLYSPNLWLH